MSKIERAIIPVAGFGVRRLPITKSIEKCMLPIGNRPTIDFVVADCLAAGVTHITFVVGEDSQQLRSYYGKNVGLEEYLIQRKKEDELAFIRSIGGNAHFEYVVQKQGEGLPYGTAVPISFFSKEIGKDEQVIVAMGDDFVCNADGSSELQRLVQQWENSGVPSALLGVSMSAEQAIRYGTIVTRKQGNNLLFESIAEKVIADQDRVLVNISKYIFDKAMFDCVDEVMAAALGNSGEYYLTDALNLYIQKQQSILVVPARGEYLDSGSEQSWLYANNRVIGS